MLHFKKNIFKLEFIPKESEETKNPFIKELQ